MSWRTTARLAFFAWALLVLPGPARADDEGDAPAEEDATPNPDAARRRPAYNPPAARRQAGPTRAAPEPGGDGPGYQTPPPYQPPSYQQPSYQPSSNQAPSYQGGGDDSESSRPMPMPDLSPNSGPRVKKSPSRPPLKSKKRGRPSPDEATGDPYLDGLAPPRENPLAGLPPAPDPPPARKGGFGGMLSQFDSVRSRIDSMKSAGAKTPAPGAPAPAAAPGSAAPAPASAPAAKQPTVWNPKSVGAADPSAPINSAPAPQPEPEPPPKPSSWWDRLVAAARDLLRPGSR